MLFYTTHDSGVLKMVLQGELDEHTAVELRKQADAAIDEFASSNRAVLDLGGVSFMDSTGIGFLIGRYKKCKRYGIPLYISKINSQADKILSMSGVYTLIPKIN
ncbi:MAG: STAS domain-containing protein [Clostridia bacterium]|nr:STAS domain-containing protein [Clostridia bacterium]